MKRIFISILALSFAVTAPAMAENRDALEGDMVTHAKAASAATTSAVTAINAGDTATGCTAMRTAVGEITVAEALVSVDGPLIDADTRLDSDARTAQQGQLTDLATSFANSHSRLDALIAKYC